MIEAKKNPLFEKGFAFYLLPLFRRSFSHIFWRHTQELPKQPVIFIANHSSWWDGLLFFLLNYSLWKHDIHMMMHEKNLKTYKFFRHLGAFSIEKENPKGIVRSLQYAETLLKQGKSVVLFPQGDEFHQEVRPLEFQSGIGFLMGRNPEIPVVPVTFYYSFRHKQKPEVWIHQGPPLTEVSGTTRQERTDALRQGLTHQLDGLRKQVITENTIAFQDLLKKR